MSAEEIVAAIRHHEAAHAYVAAAHGVAVRWIWIDPATAAETAHVSLDDVDDAAKTGAALEIALAGRVAAALFFGPGRFHFAEVGVSGDDEAASASARRLARLTGRPQSEILRDARRRVARLVEDGWPSICALAMSLQANGDYIGPEDIGRALRFAMQGHVYVAPRRVEDTITDESGESVAELEQLRDLVTVAVNQEVAQRSALNGRSGAATTPHLVAVKDLAALARWLGGKNTWRSAVVVRRHGADPRLFSGRAR